jgi:formate-dependent nitrite reductase membrane component NrfD
MINKPPTGALPPTSTLWLKLTGAVAFILALFFGYPGLELGILGSRPLWANPTNPLIFLLTGVISGMAFAILLWTFLGRRETAGPAGTEALRNLVLPALVGLFLVLNVMAYVTLSYASPGVREAMRILATGELGGLFVGVGLVLGALLPALLLTWNAFRPRPLRWVATASTLLLVLGAFAQKYGFVVAGQVANPPGGEAPSLWPTATEIVEFAAVLAFLYFLFQVAFWISPWRTVPAEPEPPAKAEVPA